MDNSDWLDLWDRNAAPPFHWDVPNPLIRKHFTALALPKGGHVLVPLCGKSLDIGWLRSQGQRVTGIELSRRAVDALFAELGITPEITSLGRLVRFSAPGLTVFVGDIFDVSRDDLGPVDAVYDRAALIALPPDVRPLYTAHLAAITGRARQLVLSFEDGRAPDDGPPFPVYADEIDRLYGTTYGVTLIDTTGPDGNPATDLSDVDTVWLMHPRQD